MVAGRPVNLGVSWRWVDGCVWVVEKWVGTIGGILMI